MNVVKFDVLHVKQNIERIVKQHPEKLNQFADFSEQDSCLSLLRGFSSSSYCPSNGVVFHDERAKPGSHSRRSAVDWYISLDAGVG